MDGGGRKGHLPAVEKRRRAILCGQEMSASFTRNRPTRRGVCVAALLLLAAGTAMLLAACATQKVEDPLFDKAPLFGMIYDADNQPCDGVQLTVDGVPGPLTDIRGRFMIPDLTRGPHT